MTTDEQAFWDAAFLMAAKAQMRLKAYEMGNLTAEELAREAADVADALLAARRSKEATMERKSVPQEAAPEDAICAWPFCGKPFNERPTKACGSPYLHVECAR